MDSLAWTLGSYSNIRVLPARGGGISCILQLEQNFFFWSSLLMRFFVGSLICVAETEEWKGSWIQWHFLSLDSQMIC